MQNFIFDFDGTIADTTAQLLDLGNEVLAESGRPPIDAAEFQRLRGLTFAQGMREFGISMRQMPGLVVKFRSKLHDRVTSLQVIPGMPETIRALHEQGKTMGIISSSTNATIGQFLERNQLTEYFSFVHAGLSLFGKNIRVKQAMRRHRLAKEETFYIGDEVRDIDAARAVGIKVASVTWGLNNRDVLAQHQPDWLIDQPSQLLDC